MLVAATILATIVLMESSKGALGFRAGALPLALAVLAAFAAALHVLARW